MIRRQGWAGTTLADRRAGRRQRLLDAGLELLGSQGSAAVTVRSVCRASGLTDRYFYENFADREALLDAVYDEVAAEFGRVLSRAVADAVPGADPEPVARAAVDAFLALITADPRKGRVLLLEPLTDQTLRTRSVELAPAFARIISEPLAGRDDAQVQLAATAIVGAIANLFTRWLDGSLAVGRADLADYCVRLVLAALALDGELVSRPGPRR